MKLQNISSLPQLARAYIKLAHVLCHISKFAPNRKTPPVPKLTKGKPPTLHNLQKLNYSVYKLSPGLKIINYANLKQITPNAGIRS